MNHRFKFNDGFQQRGQKPIVRRNPDLWENTTNSEYWRRSTSLMIRSFDTRSIQLGAKELLIEKDSLLKLNSKSAVGSV